VEAVQDQRALRRTVAPAGRRGQARLRVRVHALPALDLGQLRLTDGPRQPPRQAELAGGERQPQPLAASLGRQRAARLEPLEGRVAGLRPAGRREPGVEYARLESLGSIEPDAGAMGVAVELELAAGGEVRLVHVQVLAPRAAPRQDSAHWRRSAALKPSAACSARKDSIASSSMRPTEAPSQAARRSGNNG
jgi:hypothetical protein